MSVNEFIESGILELYVAGALSAGEIHEVEAMASTHPEVRAEIKEIENAMELLATSQRRNPRPELRAIILERIAHIENELVDAQPASVGENHKAKIFPIAPTSGNGMVARNNTLIRYSLAASVLLAVLATALAVIFGMKWQQTKQELVETERARNSVMADAATMRTSLDQTTHDLSVVRDDRNRIVTMNGLAPDPNAHAVVYWNAKTREVHLDAGSLPAVPDDKEYQLWALVDGKPVDAGVFTPQGPGLRRMKSIESADAFAVTLEPRGGSPTPTLDAMYALGKI